MRHISMPAIKKRMPYLSQSRGMHKYAALLALYILLGADMSAQKYYRYDNVDLSDGLSSNYTDCIYEDSRGYIWIGTWDGLNRYDGLRCTQYKSDYTDSTNRVAGNWIFNITEDSQHRLWICSNNGLSRYDYRYDHFEIIPSFYGCAVKCVAQSADGSLWVSTVNGLYQYDCLHHRVREHYRHSQANSTLISNDLSDIVLDAQQNLWIATISSGLIHLNTKTREQVVYQQGKGSAPLPSNKIRTLAFDSQHRLWIGTFDNGIAILDTAARTVSYMTHDRHDPHSIGSNGISHLRCDSKGNMWVCCQNGYLNRYDRSKNRFVRYDYNAYTSNSLKTKSVSYVFEDKVGNYWIGTHGNGAACLNVLKNQFKSYSVMPHLALSLPENKISSFLEMDDGSVLVGTDGGGLCVFDRDSETFQTYSTGQGLLSDAVTHLSRGRDGQVWVSTWNGGIALFDYHTRKITSYAHDYRQRNSLIFNNTKHIQYTGDTLWIATHGEGIALYDIARRRFLSHLDSGRTPFDLKAPTWANSIYRDSKHRYWIGTAMYLYCFDGKQLHTYMMEVNNDKTISGNQIFSIFEDSRGTIWVVTDGGTDTFREKDNSFERFSQKHHLPRNIKAITEDNRHRLWMSTGAELLCFDPQTKALSRITQDEGLPQNDFIQQAAATLRDGTLLFGGSGGFVMFHPDSLRHSDNRPRVELTDISVDYRVQTPGLAGSILTHALQDTDTLYWNYSASVVSVAFAGIDFSNPHALSYRYQIQGVNKDWLPIGKERRITLPTLAPGDYLIRIQAYTPGGIFSGDRLLTAVVLPAWWQTWWFRLLAAAACAGMIAAVFNYRIQRIKAHNRLLEKMVSERTSALTAANAELKELNNTKNTLFSIIAHDLKNPINILTGYSSMLIRNFSSINDSKKLNYIEHIAQSSKNIYRQLEQLLNWAMAQSNNLSHTPRNTDISILVNEALALVSEMSLIKQITVRTDIAVSHMIYADAEMIGTVVRNLVTNALKFTKPGGTITIKAAEKETTIVLSIADTGVGMSEEQLAHLFKVQEHRSSYGTNNEKGTGLGLVICKEFVEKNGGTIQAESSYGHGTRFIISLPIGSEFIVKLTDTAHRENKSTATDTPAAEKPADRPLLLIVEDTASMAQYIHDALQDRYEIVLAENGRLGLAKCRELLPDLILSDVSMPEMDGEQLCLAIKSDPLTSHIPLILLTARNQPQQQLDGLRKGADDYMFKPFDAAILEEKINSVLKNRERYSAHIKRQMICEPNAPLPPSQDDAFLGTAVRIIEDNIAEPHLSVEYLAREMGMSRAQLFRKFKAIIGQAPADFIRTIKLRRAAQMLRSGSRRVSDVAYAVGFADAQYFSNCFQKEYGAAPSQYAKDKS